MHKLYQIASDLYIFICRVNSKALRIKAYSGLIFIGNETLRPIRINIRKTRLIDDEGYELLQEFYLTVLTFMIDGSISPKIARYPDIWKLRTIYLRRRASGKTPEEKADDKTNADITPEKIQTWKNGIQSGSADEKIDAIRNLDEIEPLTSNLEVRNILIDMVKTGPPSEVRVILSVFGSDEKLDPQIRQILLDYIDSPNRDLALAAAKALRFKDILPMEAERILDHLEQLNDEVLRKFIEKELLCCLDSPRAFKHLVRAIKTGPTHGDHTGIRKDKMHRINDLKIWYQCLGHDRDNRVRKAIAMVEQSCQDKVIDYLQDMSGISFHSRSLQPDFVPEIKGQWGGDFLDENYYMLQLSKFRAVFNDPRLSGGID